MRKLFLIVLVAILPAGCAGELRKGMRAHAKNLDVAANELDRQAEACSKDASLCDAAWSTVKMQASAIESTSHQIAAEAGTK